MYAGGYCFNYKECYTLVFFFCGCSSMILKLYSLLTIVNVKVCDGSKKTVNPFTHSVVLMGETLMLHPLRGSCSDILQTHQSVSRLKDLYFGL